MGESVMTLLYLLLDVSQPRTGPICPSSPSFAYCNHEFRCLTPLHGVDMWCSKCESEETEASGKNKLAQVTQLVSGAEIHPPDLLAPGSVLAVTVLQLPSITGTPSLTTPLSTMKRPWPRPNVHWTPRPLLLSSFLSPLTSSSCCSTRS